MRESTSAGPILVRGGCLLDPSQGLNERGDLLLAHGRVAALIFEERIEGDREGMQELLRQATVLPAEGMVVAPGFVDLHCHLREPGYEHKETIATGTRAAARGGFTTVCCMPNTQPPIDRTAVVEYVKRTALAEGVVRVLPIGCITRGQEGRELAQMAELAEAGVVGFSDDGHPVESSRLMRYALEYASMLNLPVIDHCEDLALAKGAEMNEGPIAARLGLKGNPAAAEEIAVARDLSLAELTGGWIHIAHLSTAGAVDLVRRAKARGIRVTAEVTPHHLTLTEDWVAGAVGRGKIGLLRPPDGRPPYDTNTKVAPPLRTQRDVEALIEGLRDGTIDAIVTDHAPHAWEDKACEYGLAASGISGFETALSALLSLVHAGRVDLPTLISKLTWEPARLLAEQGRRSVSSDLEMLGTLRVGAPADVVVIDPDAEWVVDPQDFASKGRNTPLAGVTLQGRVVITLCGGRVVYDGRSSN